MKEADGIICIAATFMAIVTLFVWLRLFVRFYVQDLNVDDYLVVFGWVCTVVFYTFMVKATAKGFGHHVRVVSIDNIIGFRRDEFAISISFSLGVTSAKASMSILYLRIFPYHRFLTNLSKALTVFLLCEAVTETMFVIFRCHPVSAAFSLDSYDKCLHLGILGWMTFAFGTTTTIALFIQPMAAFWTLKLSASKRLGLGVMLSFGLFVCIISVIRIIYGTKIRSEFAHELCILIIWSSCELATLLICCCLPGLRQAAELTPLIRRCLGLSNYYSCDLTKDGEPTPPMPMERLPRRDYIQHGNMGAPGQFGNLSVAAADANDSTEEIFPRQANWNGAILVTKEVAFDVERASKHGGQSPSHSSS